MSSIVMQADGDLVRQHAGVFDLIAHFIEQLPPFDADSEPVDADVLVGPAELAGPAPGLAAHLAVQLVQEGLAEYVPALAAPRLRLAGC